MFPLDEDVAITTASNPIDDRANDGPHLYSLPPRDVFQCRFGPQSAARSTIVLVAELFRISEWECLQYGVLTGGSACFRWASIITLFAIFLSSILARPLQPHESAE